MNPFRFGSAGRELFGVYFAPSGRVLRRTAVLLCPPFGPEATRAHRLYRVLGERLSRAGFGVLRFDYYGTGDSDGAFEDATLADWTRDVAIAARELIARSGARSAAVVGLRLGATLAWLAGMDIVPPPSRIVAWDPIVDGAQYLDELRQAHVEFLQRDYGLGWLAVRGKYAAPVHDEALGFPLTERMRADLAAIRVERLANPGADVRVVASIESAPLAALERATPWAKWQHVRSSTPWNSDDAMNSSIVPADLLDAIVAALEDLP